MDSEWLSREEAAVADLNTLLRARFGTKKGEACFNLARHLLVHRNQAVSLIDLSKAARLGSSGRSFGGYAERISDPSSTSSERHGANNQLQRAITKVRAAIHSSDSASRLWQLWASGYGTSRGAASLRLTLPRHPPNERTVIVGETKLTSLPILAHATLRTPLSIIAHRVGSIRNPWVAPEPLRSQVERAAVGRVPLPTYSLDEMRWTSRGFPKTKPSVVETPPTKAHEVFNGWLWGCTQAVTQNYTGGAATLLKLEVERVRFRDYRIYGAKDDYLVGGRPARKLLADALAGKEGMIPPQAVLVLHATVVLTAPDRRRWIVLALRHNRVRMWDASTTKFWTDAATTFALSERVRDDWRGPGLEAQVQRMMERQLAITLPNLSMITWTGALENPSNGMVSLHCVVEPEMTLRELFELYGRRSLRHFTEKLVALREEDVSNALSNGRLMEYLNSGSDSSHQVGTMLPSSLLLLLAARGKAQVC